MITYVILFCFISLCNAESKVSGDYTELIFSQHLLTSTFLHKYMKFSDSTLNPKKYKNYVSEHRDIFKEHKWVINGLWCSDSRTIRLERCKDRKGKSLNLDSNIFRSFKEELNAKWPPVVGWSTESNLSIDYASYGSCVTENTRFYIEEALRLFETYYIGSLFENVIIPSKTYYVHEIVGHLTSKLGKIVNVNCIKPAGSQIQYLSEIELCFNRKTVLQNCKYERNLCDVDKLIEFPVLPEDYL